MNQSDEDKHEQCTELLLANWGERQGKLHRIYNWRRVKLSTGGLLDQKQSKTTPCTVFLLAQYNCLPNNPKKMNSFQNRFGHHKLTIIMLWPQSWRGQVTGDRGMVTTTQPTGSAQKWRSEAWTQWLGPSVISQNSQQLESVMSASTKMSQNRGIAMVTSWWWSPRLAPPTRHQQKVSANILAMAHTE